MAVPQDPPTKIERTRELHRSGDPSAAREATLRSRRWPWQSADSVCENRIL